jgi:hypothetical protein
LTPLERDSYHSRLPSVPAAHHLGARELACAAGAILLSLALNRPFVAAGHGEGDELVHQLLADQLAQGRYTLRGTVVMERPLLFPPALYDRPIHYNPPLFNAALLGLSSAGAPPGLLPVASTAVTAALACLLAARRAGVLAGAVAALAFAGCPIARLSASKVWAEAFLGLLLVASLYVLDGMLLGRDAGRRGRLLLLGVLLAAASLTKTTAVLALPALLLGAWQIEDPVGRRRAARVVFLASAGSALAWLAFVAVVSGQALPAAVAPDPSKMQNGFVRAMAAKNPGSFLYEPFLLNPAYLFAGAAAARAWRRVDGWPLLLFPLCVLLGYTVLALAGIGTYHMKYAAIAMPGLAVLAGTGFAAVIAGSGIRRWTATFALSACLAVLAYQNTVYQRTLPQKADVSAGDFLRTLGWRSRTGR